MRAEFAALVSPGTGRDKKGPPIDAPSIHIGALVAPWTRSIFIMLLGLGHSWLGPQALPEI